MSQPGNAPVVSARLPVTVRPASTVERTSYILGSWAEGYKHSPRMRKKLWSDYKAVDRPKLAAVLERSDTTLLVADHAGHPVGWIAFARWPSIDAVHWVYTRTRISPEGEPLRRRGVMGALFDAARLKTNLVYTHLGAVLRASGRVDERIAEWLRSRGAAVSYHAYAEWARPAAATSKGTR